MRIAVFCLMKNKRSIKRKYYHQVIAYVIKMQYNISKNINEEDNSWQTH